MFSIKDCGLMIEPQQGMKVDEIVDWAQFAEREGFGYFFRSDHILSMFTANSQVDSPECWASLGVVAASTKTIKFGPMVSPVGFRNPALVARMACTLDSYSKGRMIMSHGAGWYEIEYKAHGIPYPNFKQRKEELIDALRIIRPILEGKRVDYDGKYFSAHVECFPKPYNGKIPLVVGGRHPKVLDATCEYADEVNIFSSPLDELIKLKSVVLAKNPKAEISQMGSFVIGMNNDELDERISRFAKLRGLDSKNPKQELQNRGVLVGTPEEAIEQINERRKAGVSRFYFQILDTKNREMVETLAATLKDHF